MPSSLPILWRFLFKQYIKVLTLCASAFVTVLMTLRMNDIANFASFGANGQLVLQFAFNQMIFILPYALPLSCFLSSILLIQRLSASHELTALRACGFSFHDIFYPLFLTSLVLAGANFLLVSEAATIANTSNYQLKEKLRSMNPLVLLHNKHLMNLKGIRFISLGPSKIDQFVNHAILATSNKDKTKLHLLLAKYIESDRDHLIFENVTLFTNLGSESEEEYDKLLIENAAKATTPASAFSTLLQENSAAQPPRIERLPLLRLVENLHQEKYDLIIATEKEDRQKLKRSINRSYIEIIRRVSSGFSPVTFTFMGLAFGITISRRQSRFKLATAVALLAFYLVVHLMARDFKDRYTLSIAFYIIPHLIILSLSFWRVNRLTRGVEP